MLEFRDKDGDPLFLAVKGELPVHVETAQLDAQDISKIGSRNIQVLRIKSKSLKKHAGMKIRVLLGIDDIHIVVGQHSRRCGNESLAICTRDNKGSCSRFVDNRVFHLTSPPIGGFTLSGKTVNNFQLLRTLALVAQDYEVWRGRYSDV
jgi:hypothetical protein